MRTAFAAATLAAATSAYEFDAIAVPDFIAGFIYGLTGDNKLTKIEACYQGGDTVVTDAQTALADIKAGHLINGAKEFVTVSNDVKLALSNCENMDDDFAEIGAWLKSFEDVGHLTKTVTKTGFFTRSKLKPILLKKKLTGPARTISPQEKTPLTQSIASCHSKQLKTLPDFQLRVELNSLVDSSMVSLETAT